MSKVVFDISMSLDGFMTASNRSPEEPMGDGGQHLHEWAFGQDEQNREYLEGAIAGTGAVIAGRDTHVTSVPWWGADGPSGPARRPVFVVTHNVPADSPEGGVYTILTDGIESTLKQATEAACDQIVSAMGGASIGQQYIAAGLVDEAPEQWRFPFVSDEMGQVLGSAMAQSDTMLLGRGTAAPAGHQQGRMS